MFTIFFANSWPLSSEFSYLKLWNFSLSSFMIFFHALADSSFTAPLWANNNAADNNCSKHNFKHQSNVWNLFKVNNIDIRTLAMEFYFKHCFLLALVSKERKKQHEVIWGYFCGVIISCQQISNIPSFVIIDIDIENIFI